jgi:plasmid stabilization system protein ParE
VELRFTELAETELREATRYYANLGPELAALFRTEAETAARRILAHPRAWTVELGEVRRFLFNRFPYKLLYAIEADHIVVLAVAHQHRHPDYWIERTPRVNDAP